MAFDDLDLPSGPARNVVGGSAMYAAVAASLYTPARVVAVVGDDFPAEALTMLPGSTADYDQTDFVRDLFLLDRSGVTHTKSGAACSLPASTGTKTSITAT